MYIEKEDLINLAFKNLEDPQKNTKINNSDPTKS